MLWIGLVYDGRERNEWKVKKLCQLCTQWIVVVVMGELYAHEYGAYLSLCARLLFLPSFLVLLSFGT